jgi:hypothetical protein
MDKGPNHRRTELVREAIAFSDQWRRLADAHVIGLPNGAAVRRSLTASARCLVRAVEELEAGQSAGYDADPDDAELFPGAGAGTRPGAPELPS